MSSIDPMTSKSKPILPEVTNQSNMNKRPGVIQSTYCVNPPYARHQLISPGLMTAMLTSLVSKYYKRLHCTFSRLLVMGPCWSWVRAGHGGFHLKHIASEIQKNRRESVRSELFIRGSPDIKVYQHSRVGSEFGVHQKEIWLT